MSTQSKKEWLGCVFTEDVGQRMDAGQSNFTHSETKVSCLTFK